MKMADNPFSTLPLRYLIGADATEIQPASGYATELPYDFPKYLLDLNSNLLRPVIGYVNSLDEEFDQSIFGPKARYGPYVHGDTASDWDEGQMVGGSPGFMRCLVDQFRRWQKLKTDAIEIDNLDSYLLRQCMKMFDLASEEFGLKLIAKNIVNVEGDHVQLLAHPAVVGAIVEAGCGTCDQMQDLRKLAGKPDLPIWFVSNRKERHWADQRVSVLQHNDYKNMSVSWCASSDDYSIFTTLFKPRV